MNRDRLEQYGLSQIEDVLHRFEKEAIAFKLRQPDDTFSTRSRLGGRPILPAEYEWPTSNNRPLDFLLQIDLADLPPNELVPPSGLLTFFYDLDNQPWGFDPKELDGFRVDLIRSNSLVPFELPNPEFVLPERIITFNPVITLPEFGSRSYDLLDREAQFVERQSDNYFELIRELEQEYTSAGLGYANRLLGHSSNIQGDMQLEAQLVTNGLYCGDPSGYEDQRAKELERGADEWMLLLQLSSDDDAELMWGDGGMLYYWIRREDLLKARFDRTWMGLQCF
jgi:uncharacterized protein YwqG